MVATTEQIDLHKLLCQIFLLSSIPTYIVTRYLIVAPFGRHVPDDKRQRQDRDHKRGKRNGHLMSTTYRWWFGPKFNARISWFCFEYPNLIWVWYCSWHWYDPATLYFLDDSSPTTASRLWRVTSRDENHRTQISTNAILLCLFALHYINRAIVYPLRMNPNSNPVPLVVILFATLVTTWNGYLQCFYLAQIENTFAPLSFSLLSASSSENAITWLGICLFFVGMGINVHSDGVLRNLRRRNNNDSLATKTQQHDQQKPEYYIPHSPFFKYISCPNRAGEILEWFGYTLASRFSLPSVAFFVYTVSNLVPRAVAHHKWYLRKFEDYPLERKWAVVPFVV